MSAFRILAGSSEEGPASPDSDPKPTRLWSDGNGADEGSTKSRVARVRTQDALRLCSGPLCELLSSDLSALRTDDPALQ